MSEIIKQAESLKDDWQNNPRWADVYRPYSAEEVVRLRGSLVVEHTLATRGAHKLWDLIHNEDYVPCLGALTGGQAMQQVKAGVKAIYLSGWQVAADANTSETMYPDQSLYAVNSVPTIVSRINNAFTRADQILNKSFSLITDHVVLILDLLLEIAEFQQNLYLHQHQLGLLYKSA
jgi:isocitrate lyase